MHSPQHQTLRCQLDPILPEDLDRILRATGLPEDQLTAIRSLLEDETERFQLLDQPFFRGIILEAASELDESLVCYIRVRTQLLRAGIRNLKTAIYLTHVWLNYRAKGILPEQGQSQGPVIETVDILRELNFVKGYEKFELLTMSGNYYLFLMAFFEDYFHELEAHNGQLNTAYYEAFARISYRAARDHGLSEEFDLSDVCNDLSENFSTIRTAISNLQEAPAPEPTHT
ncbi:MAG: hypothetical protein ACLFU4_04520 [Opitutales bacterium]